METARTAPFEIPPEGHAARAGLAELLRDEVRDADFVHERRHELERAITHISTRLVRGAEPAAEPDDGPEG